MSTDVKNPDEPTKKDVRFIDGKLKVVELDKKGIVIKVIRDYTGPNPNNKKPRNFKRFRPEHIVNPIKENIEGIPIRFIMDSDTDKSVRQEKEVKVDLTPISTVSPVKHEVRFVDDKLRVVEVDKMGKVIKVVRDYPTKILPPVEVVKPSTEHTAELIIKSTIETLAENVTRGAPRFVDVPEEKIEEKPKRIIKKPIPEPIIEEKVEEKIEENVEIFPPPDVQELLDNDKFYDENTRLIICPECHKYGVEFLSETKKWYCTRCMGSPHYDDYKFSDKNKYQIYKLWDMYALMDVAHVKLDMAKRFVASYFKKCCNTKKDKCLYFGIFEEEHITDKFEIAKMNCGLLRENIEENSAVIETIKSLLDEDIQVQIDEEYTFLLQVSGLMTTQLDDYVIATANVDLEKDQAAYVIVDNDNITVDLNPVEGMECIECFTWNGVNKGGAVGVSSLPSNSLNELRQMFKFFTEKMNQYINTDVLKNISKMEDRIKSLSSEEKKVLSFIHSNKNGCLQNQLWKKLDIGKEKRLVILESLKDLIIKETIKYCSTYTYRLRTIELGILSLELEINSKQMATEKKTIKKRTYKRKRKEKSE